jgi:NADPH:quinone reductase-like Zn-dependent oxidoreductase
MRSPPGRRRTVRPGRSRLACREDLAVLKELVEADKVAPVIDRRYELSEVPEALRHQGEGHTQGKIVIAL